MNTLPEGPSSPRETTSPAATLFMAFLTLVAIALIGYFAFAPRPAPEPTDRAIAVEEAGRALTGTAGAR